MEKPKPRSKNKNSQKNDQSNSKIVNNSSNLSKKVPLMFQASIQGRCQLQREGDNRQSQIYDWTDQWIKNYPNHNSSQTHTVQEKTETKKNTQSLAFARPPKPSNTSNIKSNEYQIKIPQFSQSVKTREYKINWRLVTNCGQDDIIRPIIGAKGYPYFSGASMKGAFRRVCDPETANRYCGKEDKEKGDFSPGILRFHGAYPLDNSWTNNLVDLVHFQQEKQVIQDQTTNAIKQISLYKVTLRFGISSTKQLTETEWNKIWELWEKALGYGLGSRVTASYGHFEDITVQQELLSIDLKGQGIASTLTDRNKTPEFRPNMFKAVLRGHTLRLLGGITNESTAKKLTNILWGGIDNTATVGLLGIVAENTQYKFKKLNRQTTFQLDKITLKIFLTNRNLTLAKKEQLTNIAQLLLQFSMLFGGFGKSWRRVDHSIFFPEYLKNSNKSMIGCHWEFIDNPNFLDLSNDNIRKKVSKFIDSICSSLKEWANTEISNLSSQTPQTWREIWKKHSVKVYGRIATNKDDSHGVKWFHQNYTDHKSIKNSILTGELGKTGRIWHRMYPFQNDKYVELLTIFPDNSQRTTDFLGYLDSNSSEFQRLW